MVASAATAQDRHVSGQPIGASAKSTPSAPVVKVQHTSTQPQLVVRHWITQANIIPSDARTAPPISNAIM
jgi:hypothetical protein